MKCLSLVIQSLDENFNELSDDSIMIGIIIFCEWEREWEGL